MAKPVPVPAFVNHSLLTRVANSFGSSDAGPYATHDDICLLVAAIVCGGPTLVVDPTVPSATVERSGKAADILDLEFRTATRPATTRIADASSSATPLLRSTDRFEDLADVQLTPDPTDDHRAANLTESHRQLLDNLLSKINPAESGSDEMREASIWLCEGRQEAAWGNKLLAGICRQDADADPAQRLLARYAQGLDRASSLGCAYSYVGAYVSRFRSGYLPAVASDEGTLHYSTTTNRDLLSDHVAVVDKLIRRLSGQTGSEDSAEDRLAAEALAWASHDVILHGNWNHLQPVSLVEAAVGSHGTDPTDLMSWAVHTGKSDEDGGDMIDRLAERPDQYVRESRPKRAAITIASLVSVMAVGATSEALLLGSTSLMGMVEGSLAGGAVGSALGYAVAKGTETSHREDVAAARLILDSMRESRRSEIEARLDDMAIPIAP